MIYIRRGMRNGNEEERKKRLRDIFDKNEKGRKRTETEEMIKVETAKKKIK